MSRRKDSRNNRKRSTKKRIKKSNKPYVIGWGVIFILFFIIGKISYAPINESELMTVEGDLSSKLIQESSGGTQKKYFWTFTLKDQPVRFSVQSYAYDLIDVDLFQKTESKASKIKVQVNANYYKTILANPKKYSKVYVVALTSSKRHYFSVYDYKNAYEEDQKFLYVFLFIGVISFIFGLSMKK